MKTTLFALGLAYGILCTSRGIAPCQPYTFTTIAGSAGLIGVADGTNTGARFNFPAGLAIDSAGVLYVADLLNHTIREIRPQGTNWIVNTLAGSAQVRGTADGTNSDARFDHPAGVIVDAAGNIFVADKYNDTIRKITRSGTNCVVTTVAGLAGAQAHDDGTNSQARFWGPSGVAVDNAGHLYVVDSSNFTIRGIVPEGTNWIVTTLAGTPLLYGFVNDINEFARFDYPYSIALNNAGTLYVTDFGNAAIRQVQATGRDWATTTIAGWSGVMGTNDGLGQVAAFNDPIGIAVDSGNNVFVTDQNNHTIRKINPVGGDWNVSTIGGLPLQFGSADGTGSAARFSKPWGIAVDPAGNLFIADYRNQTIRMGIPLTLQILLSGNQVVLSWPVAASNYVLETTPTLTTAASWTPLSNGIAISGDNFILTNAAAGPAAFYRLSWPSSR